MAFPAQPVATQQQVMSPSAPGPGPAAAQGSGIVQDMYGSTGSSGMQQTAPAIFSGEAALRTGVPGVQHGSGSLPNILDPFLGGAQFGQPLEAVDSMTPDLAAPNGEPELGASSRVLLEREMNVILPLQEAAAGMSQTQLFRSTAEDAPALSFQGEQGRQVGQIHVPPGSPRPTMVRWVSRLTEFLRTTAARSADNMDRVMGEMGISTPLLTASRAPPRTSTTPTVGWQQSFLANDQGRGPTLSISPPEEFATGLAVPASWSPASFPTEPLFGPSQLAQFQRAQPPLLCDQQRHNVLAMGQKRIRLGRLAFERMCNGSWTSTPRGSNSR